MNKINVASNIAPMTTQSNQLPQESSEWVISIREKLENARLYAADRPWEKWCIYRVPRRLRDVQDDRKVFMPQTVSIGPHHYRSEQVQDMDHHKWITLDQILSRTGQDLNLYLVSIKEVEEQARACYQQPVHLSSNEFVEMLVLDGCFILELFRCYPGSTETDDPVLANQRIVGDILLDMVMLENQIPLFIVDRLWNLGNPGVYQKGQASALVLNFFNPEWLTGKPMSIKEFNELKVPLQQEECLHVLDIFRRSLLHKEPNQGANYRLGFQRAVWDNIVPRCLMQWLHTNRVLTRVSRCGQVIHRVSLLREGGVKFRKRDTNCIWDIRFKNGVLEIPTIWIQDSTLTTLLNVALFEQCHLKIKDAVIASYVVFMECLIKTPEDVGYLHRCGIIQHLLGDDAKVVDMFKSISKETIVDSNGSFYTILSDQVNAYYNQRRNRWRASLLQKHFTNPWAIISLTAAVILLLLTGIQSFYAVYSYYYPNS